MGEAGLRQQCRRQQRRVTAVKGGRAEAGAADIADRACGFTTHQRRR